MGKDRKAQNNSSPETNRLHRILPSSRCSYRKALVAIFFVIIMFIAKHSTYPWYGPLSGDTLSPDMREVSSRLGELYELLVDMAYLERATNPIEYPPHDASRNINTTLATQLGLHPLAIQLLESLPYISADANWNKGAGDLELLLYGAFADFRDDDILKESRDPLYAGVDPLDKSVGWNDEDGQYMKPWYLPLNRLGNHGVVLILNLENCHLWVIDQESGGADDALRDVSGKETPNRNSLDQYPSRPAKDVLIDFIKKFRDLEWIPGGLFAGSHEYEQYKRLYLENGWPSKFNAAAFNESRIALEEAEGEQYDAEEPFREVKKLEYWLSEGLRCDARCRIAQLDADNARIEWHRQFADPEGGKIVYASRKKELEEQLATEAERTAELQRQLEAAKAKVREVPEEVRQARLERLRRYGESFHE
jgi:hypothetical protein